MSVSPEKEKVKPAAPKAGEVQINVVEGKDSKVQVNVVSDTSRQSLLASIGQFFRRK